MLNVLCSTSKAADIDEYDFRVGIIGEFEKGRFAPKVVKIVNDQTVIVNMVRKTARSDRVDIILRIPTKDLADGQILDASGTWTCTKTEKIAEKTYLVFEKGAIKPPEKKGK